MKQVIKAIKTVKAEVQLAAAANDVDRKHDAIIRLSNLQDQLADEVIMATQPASDDCFLVIINDGEPKIVGPLEHSHIVRWCKLRKATLSSTRVAASMVSSLMEVL